MKQLVIHTETEQEYNQLMDIMEGNDWTWESWYNPNEEKNYWYYTSLTCVEYKNKFEYCDLEYFENRTDKYEIVKFKDWIKTQTKQSKTIKQTLTYEIIKVRSDGVKFEKDTIDWETIESIQKRIGEYRSQANKLQGLLTAHKNLKF